MPETRLGFAANARDDGLRIARVVDLARITTGIYASEEVWNGGECRVGQA